MKKIIGILGVAVIAATMFFSANNVAGSDADASLASLAAINMASASAEDVSGWWGHPVKHTYSTTISIGVGVATYSRTDTYDSWECDGWWGFC